MPKSTCAAACCVQKDRHPMISRVHDHETIDSDTAHRADL